MRYTVIKAFRPGGSNSPEATPGSEIELAESQARVFKALDWVKVAEPKPEPKVVEPYRPAPRTYMRRDMTAEAASETAPVQTDKVDTELTDAAAKKVPMKRAYTRRTAE